MIVLSLRIHSMCKAWSYHILEVQVAGDLTVNSYEFDDFVVARTAAYMDQYSSHIAELTVRETLDLAVRVQGGGHGEFPVKAVSSQGMKVWALIWGHRIAMRQMVFHTSVWLVEESSILDLIIYTMFAAQDPSTCIVGSKDWDELHVYSDIYRKIST